MFLVYLWLLIVVNSRWGFFAQRCVLLSVEYLGGISLSHCLVRACLVPCLNVLSVVSVLEFKVLLGKRIKHPVGYIVPFHLKIIMAKLFPRVWWPISYLLSINTLHSLDYGSLYLKELPEKKSSALPLQGMEGQRPLVDEWTRIQACANQTTLMFALAAYLQLIVTANQPYNFSNFFFGQILSLLDLLTFLIFSSQPHAFHSYYVSSYYRCLEL